MEGTNCELQPISESGTMSPGFIRTCPRVNQPKWKGTKWELKAFPMEPCACGLKRIMQLQHGREVYENTKFAQIAEDVPQSALYKNKNNEWIEKDFDGCHYFIIDEKSNFCFWNFAANPINYRAYTLESISLYLGTTPVNTWFTKNIAIEKISAKLLHMGIDDFDDVYLDFSQP